MAEHRTFLKAQAVRSPEYRRYVALLPCWLCSAVGRSQAAHADEGKGEGIKSDDTTCFPLCATQPGVAGCHDRVGAGGVFTRDERRALEQQAGRETRQRLIDLAQFDRELAALLRSLGLIS